MALTFRLEFCTHETVGYTSPPSHIQDNAEHSYKSRMATTAI